MAERHQRHFKFSLIGAALLAGGCATSRRELVIQSLEPGSTLTRVPLQSPEDSGTSLKNPSVVPISQLKGQFIRISAPNRIPQNWIVLDESATKIGVVIRRLRDTSQRENRNPPVRLVLKAYQALASNDPKSARELASRAAQLDAQLAAPHIILGLLYLNEKKLEDARVSFTKARNLDPDDKDIDVLLKSAQ